ncbi:hypothetical protein [Aliamphritea hakodatensis]|uniref:hypothetical protein n=1 Tax=Aliamphritea hakodatensis TaxID=2895352 RepID=UPI0022FDA2FA|nr:hypothetical protein [Aliamphritea hakodatensis]
MSVQQNKLAAFALATASDIPLNVAALPRKPARSESVLDVAVTDGYLQERLSSVMAALVAAGPHESVYEYREKEDVPEFEALCEKLDALFLSNGISPEKGLEALIYAWQYARNTQKNGLELFRDIDDMPGAARLNLSLYIAGIATRLINDSTLVGQSYISEAANTLLLELFYSEIAECRSLGVDEADLAALLVYVSRLQLAFDHHRQAALTLMACLELSLTSNTYEMSTLFGFSACRASVVEDIGVALSYLELEPSAIECFTQAFEMYKHGFGNRYRLSLVTTESLFSVATLHASIDQQVQAVAKYSEYLDVTKPLIKSDFLNKNEQLWTKREHASHYVMENSQPQPDKTQPCLCGSGSRYVDCCFDLHVDDAV